MKQGYFARLAQRSGLMSLNTRAAPDTAGLEVHVEQGSQPPTMRAVHSMPASGTASHASPLSPAPNAGIVGVEVAAGQQAERALPAEPNTTAPRHEAELPPYHNSMISRPLPVEGNIQETQIVDTVASERPDLQAQPLLQEYRLRQSSAEFAGHVELGDRTARIVSSKLAEQPITGFLQETEAPAFDDSRAVTERQNTSFPVSDGSMTIVERQTESGQNRAAHTPEKTYSAYRSQPVSQKDTVDSGRSRAGEYSQHRSRDTVEQISPTINIGRISVTVQAPAPKPAVAAKPRRTAAGKTAASPRLSRYYLKNI